jgi:predicted MFS family arabinose efflux permease
MMRRNSLPDAWRSPALILICGGLIVTLAMGTRHSFGLFLRPMTLELGWGRELFGFAMAVQSLVWGATQPFAGMIADRYGAGRVLIGGAIFYVCGVILMAYSTTGAMFTAAAVLVGIALAGTTFSIVFGVAGRAFPPEKRSNALGIISAAGSFGQFTMVPLAQALIGWQGWFIALLLIGCFLTLIVPLSTALVEDRSQVTASGGTQTMGEAIREAFSDRGYWLLTGGYFVCGFQVTFVGVHFPAYVVDRGLSVEVGTIALALIGLFNIAGTYTAGRLGANRSKKGLLAAIYLSRSVVFLLLLALPPEPWVMFAFAASIGFLWLSTVPLTNGLVGQMFGVRYLSTLGGVVFFSHQLGSFTGVWLGGYLYDTTGSYQSVWIGSVVLGILAAVVNLLVNERRVPSPHPA